MVVEIFSICDAATDYGGRLNVLGAFEGIGAPQAPVVRERCSVAVRLRFAAAESGAHAIAIRLESEICGMVIPELKAQMNVKVQQGCSSGAFNLVINLNHLRFPEFGEYQLRLIVDGKDRSALPLTVARVTKKQGRARNPMEN